MMQPGLLDLSGRAVFVPVRHHSPACARAVRRLIRELRPSVVLIEGPSDFNDRMAELLLPHQLPIAIYTYVRRSDGLRRGAYYPFAVFSPEWQALRTAGELGIPARFIDLPWRDMVSEELPTHRYADGELRYSDYIAALCARVGVDDFDALWDTLFEIDRELSPAEYMKRAHHFCCQARELDRHVPEEDLRREAFMAEQIRSALAEFSDRILVVTGGFHSPALYDAVLGTVPTPLPAPEQPADAEDPDSADEPAPEHLSIEAGIALTPYSYERLDGLTGYDSGMPNPGFYHGVWEDREAGRGGTHRRLLKQVVRELRKRGQLFSTADLIAVETTAQGLAALRGHAEIWRADLIDGIVGGLVKDELEHGLSHPFLEAIHGVFRGGERGRLADGAELPPLVHDLQRILHEYDLEPGPRERLVDLELMEREGLERSRVLHRVAGLCLPGFDRIAGTDLVARDDLSRLWERWRIRWSPEFEAARIEAALYGPTLEEACGARLLEQAEALDRTAEQGARLLLEARLMGLERLPAEFLGRLVELIRTDGSFYGVTGALGHLLYLYRYDEALGEPRAAEIGELLEEAWGRGLWLLEGLGSPEGTEKPFLSGLRALLRTFESCGSLLDLNRDQLVEVLRRAAGDDAAHPLVRGAASGALWTLGEAGTDALSAGMRYCADPSRLGDYLVGLFSLARETVQRVPELAVQIDSLLMTYSDEQFLEALPPLRLAFTFFTPREKHYLARTLLRTLGLEESAPLDTLEVTPEVAARALALEAGVFRAVERYGLRGAAPAGGAVPGGEQG